MDNLPEYQGNTNICSLSLQNEVRRTVARVESTSAFIDTAPKGSRAILRRLSDYFDKRGCISYVKTIYIGYEFDGQMVAAAYPFATFVEVALALPEEHPSSLLKDATHLTWKTMPVLLTLNSASEVLSSTDLLGEAFDRVSSGMHAIDLPNDRFKERVRRPGQKRFY